MGEEKVSTLGLVLMEGMAGTSAPAIHQLFFLFLFLLLVLSGKAGSRIFSNTCMMHEDASEVLEM